MWLIPAKISIVQCSMPECHTTQRPAIAPELFVKCHPPIVLSYPEKPSNSLPEETNIPITYTQGKLPFKKIGKEEYAKQTAREAEHFQTLPRRLGPRKADALQKVIQSLSISTVST
jgi:hypothetical protein